MNKDEWGTPQWLFEDLDSEFNFDLDPCCNPSRPLSTKWNISKDRNGLKQRWHGNVFINPPYSGRKIETWVRKADEEYKNCDVIVMLIPTTKTGTIWFRELVLDKGVEIRYITGRINFVPLAGQNDNSNPLYSMLLIWKPEQKQEGE